MEIRGLNSTAGEGFRARIPLAPPLVMEAFASTRFVLSGGPSHRRFPLGGTSRNIKQISKIAELTVGE